MKKLLSILVLICLVSLFMGCNGVVPPPPDEPPLDLIREYTARDYVQRWPNGEVSVCDTIGGTKEIWDEINEIIDGPVSFKLTDDTTAQIGIEFQPIDGMFYVGFPEMEGDTFRGCGILINPETPSDLLGNVCLTTVLIAVGINNYEKWEEGFSQNMKTVIYWLYRLEPGYPLT